MEKVAIERVYDFKSKVAKEIGCTDDSWMNSRRIKFVPDSLIERVLNVGDAVKASNANEEVADAYNQLVDALKECVAFDITSRV